MLQGEHSAILSTCNKLPFVIQIFVLPIFEWLFYTGFTVNRYGLCVLITIESTSLGNLLNIGNVSMIKLTCDKFTSSTKCEENSWFGDIAYKHLSKHEILVLIASATSKASD